MANEIKRVQSKERKNKNHFQRSKGVSIYSGIPGVELNGVLEINVQFSKGRIQKTGCSFKKDGQFPVQKKGGRNEPGPAPYEAFKEAYSNEQVFIKTNKILQKLCLSDVLYIKAMGDYVCIYTTDKKITVHANLKSLEKKLPEKKFIRIHRSYMVSLSKIEAIEESTLYISSHPIPIGEAYRNELMKYLSILK